MKLGYRLYIYIGYYFWKFIEQQHMYLSSKKKVIDKYLRHLRPVNDEHENADNITT